MVPMLVIIVLFVVTIANARLYRFPQSSKAAIQDWRPYNVAHRGSNGEIPEETAEAYERAIEEGADFIESDITATKDGGLICFHDPVLDDVTNIDEHPEFRDRKSTYEFEGQNLTGFFVVDFTFDELQTLRVRQRYSFRDPSFNGKLRIIKFDDFISIALNASRTVGIYPEIKSPVFMNKHVKWDANRRFEDVFVETLRRRGYKGTYRSDDWNKRPIFIQSFAPTSLLYISNFTDSPKVLLIDDTKILTQDTNQTYAELTSNKYLDFISNYVVGIGPWKDTIVPLNSSSLHIQERKPISPFRFPRRSLSRIRLLDQNHESRWTLHRFPRKLVQIPGMELQAREVNITSTPAIPSKSSS